MSVSSDDLLDAAEVGRRTTGALVIAVSGSAALRKTVHALFSKLGASHSAESAAATLASLPDAADYAVVDITGTNAAETAFLTWLARPHILLVEDGNEDALDGMEPGGIVICDRASANYRSVAAAARESGSVGLFSIGEEETSSAMICESLRAGNGVRATFDVMAEKVSLTLPDPGADLTTALYALLAAVVSGHDLTRAGRALEAAWDERNRMSSSCNVSILGDNRACCARPAAPAFQVLALVDPGRGGRRMAFLSHMDASEPFDGRLDLPTKAANLDLVYMGQSMQGRGDRTANGNGTMGEIVPDVLSPGDVVMVRKSKSGAVDAIVETLRALPSKMLKGPDAEYAL
ncbi:MAG: hypothetical protein EOM26_01620 [Alphaproteobacteria bacterium]|nr:hypothetical protein [Alphaproteobacteria bacterium]